MTLALGTGTGELGTTGDATGEVLSVVSAACLGADTERGVGGVLATLSDDCICAICCAGEAVDLLITSTLLSVRFGTDAIRGGGIVAGAVLAGGWVCPTVTVCVDTGSAGGLALACLTDGAACGCCAAATTTGALLSGGVTCAIEGCCGAGGVGCAGELLAMSSACAIGRRRGVATLVEVWGAEG